MKNSILLFKSTQPSTLESVRILRQSLSKVLDHLDIKADIKQYCLLCCSEWCTNIIHHSTPLSNDITVSFRKAKKKWLLIIKDSGGIWNPLSQQTTFNINTNILKGSGYGLHIINTLADETYYQSLPSHNIFTIVWERDTHRIKPHILLVEDQKSQRELFYSYIKDIFTVSLVNNGKQALAFLKNEPVDLIISDIKMPKMNGIELRQELEKIKIFSIPFIFLSHSEDETILNDAVNLGIDDYLKKPIKKEQLLNSIHRVLARFNQVFHAISQQVNQKITDTLLPQINLNSKHWQLAFQQRNTGRGGGDFVLSTRNNGVIQLLIADVMGHDESAKFFSYAYAGYIRGLMQNTNLTQPALLLTKLSNNAYKDQLLSQTMITGCCLSFINSNTIILSCAGHPYPMHIHHKRLYPVKVEGTLPGLLPHTEYETSSITLKKNERLILLTDGLFESGNTITERETLERAIKKHLVITANLPLNVALDKIMQVFDSLAGTPPNDDALLLIIEKK
ncbi:SpoIIE family protein phosphatase [Photobacterium andalusiense]|uniref:Response regulator SaeR n=1 Tax=Photobacterium andalusiense TaxID=2204296 RepID=A0A1Y6M8A8_9GAMM|nr:SpoIIE family protein phosphatase [Photobacterium andalusiense]SMY32752.1 Response regulator SaeR [Photobacterium andalusiense]